MDSHGTSSTHRSTGYTPEQLKARALARSRRAAISRRTRRIRRTVAGFSAALFSALFLVVYVQLVSGHDPALSKRSTTSATTLTASSTSASDSAAGTEAAGGSASASPSTSTESTTGASAVTTSQS